MRSGGVGLSGSADEGGRAGGLHWLRSRLCSVRQDGSWRRSSRLSLPHPVAPSVTEQPRASSGAAGRSVTGVAAHLAASVVARSRCWLRGAGFFSCFVAEQKRGPPAPIQLRCLLVAYFVTDSERSWSQDRSHSRAGGAVTFAISCCHHSQRHGPRAPFSCVPVPAFALSIGQVQKKRRPLLAIGPVQAQNARVSEGSGERFIPPGRMPQGRLVPHRLRRHGRRQPAASSPRTPSLRGQPGRRASVVGGVPSAGAGRGRRLRDPVASWVPSAHLGEASPARRPGTRPGLRDEGAASRPTDRGKYRRWLAGEPTRADHTLHAPAHLSP